VGRWGHGCCSIWREIRQACVVRWCRGQCSAGWRITATPPSAWVSRCCA
jgi:hypothetical protein